VKSFELVDKHRSKPSRVKIRSGTVALGSCLKQVFVSVRTSISSKHYHQSVTSDENFDRQEEVRQRQEEQKRRSGDHLKTIYFSSTECVRDLNKCYSVILIHNFNCSCYCKASVSTEKVCHA